MVSDPRGEVQAHRRIHVLLLGDVEKVYRRATVLRAGQRLPGRVLQLAAIQRGMLGRREGIPDQTRPEVFAPKHESRILRHCWDILKVSTVFLSDLWALPLLFSAQILACN